MWSSAPARSHRASCSTHAHPNPEMSTMQQESLTALASHHLEIARTISSGRSAHTLYGGHDHVLRQTVIALKAGTQLDEHENPGEATLQVLQGHVTLVAGDVRMEGATGDLMPV